VASDVNPLYLKSLEALSQERPYLRASFCDVTDASTFPQKEDKFDTVVCLNVIEHVEPEQAALVNIRSALSDDGHAIVLVPQGQWNYGTLDEVLGHHRRYSKAMLRQAAVAAGFKVKELVEFNRVGTIAWFVNGRIMRRRTFGLLQIWLLDKLTPVLRLIDKALPLPGLSLIAVLAPERPTLVSQAAPAGSGGDVSGPTWATPSRPM
jgi:hypothetical protein